MGRTIVITGAASGMGLAAAEHLRRAGHRVIGVDRAGVEVSADLATPAGRAAMADQVAALAPAGIDGIVAAAGIAGMDGSRQVLAVNYFGAVATLELLRPLLLRSAAPCAVAVIPTAALFTPDEPLVDACLAGDEAATLARIAATPGIEQTLYPTSKHALARWLRAAAVTPDWAGAGILLNAVAPGSVRTPMIEPLLATAEGRAMLAKATPIALPDRAYGEPAELAEAIAFLATLQGRYLLGQILYVDGGTEAILRPGTI